MATVLLTKTRVAGGISPMHLAWELLVATFNEWLEDKAQRLGAAFAYYAVFSIAPLLVIAVYVARLIYADDSAAQIHAQIAAVMGQNGATVVVAAMQGLQMHEGGGGIATAISLILLLLGATAAFGSLQDAMNTIWEVTPKARPFLVDLVRTRLISFLMVLCFCLLLIVSLAASAALAVVAKFFEAQYPVTTMIWKFADYGLSFVLMTIVFATLYKVLPDVRISWSDVSIGAAATAVLFILGRIPLSLYLESNALSSPYGAAGSVLVLLAWVYYSAQILFFGAEFTQVYANRFGRRVGTSRGAVFLSEASRIQQGIPHTQAIEESIKKEQEKRRFAS
jgi:membrane protein